MSHAQTFFLRVYGYLWSGGRACYEYRVEAAPQSDEAAKRIAGDFESLIDWHVTRRETNAKFSRSGELAHEIVTFKTLRGWRNGFSNARYTRIVHGR